jgi:dienelactone hydrolase
MQELRLEGERMSDVGANASLPAQMRGRQTVSSDTSRESFLRELSDYKVNVIPLLMVGHRQQSAWVSGNMNWSKGWSRTKEDFDMHIYPNPAHAFFTETTPLYNKAAIKDAWESVLRCCEKACGE